MQGVDAELAEDVLAVGVDGVEAGEALLGYLAGGEAEGYVSEYMGLGGGEGDVLIPGGWRGEEHLAHALADVAPVAGCLVQGLAYLAEGRLFEHHAHLGVGGDHGADEVEAQVFAEEQPLRAGKPLGDDLELGGVADVEKGVVEHHGGIGVCAERLDELGLVCRAAVVEAELQAEVLESGLCDALPVGDEDEHGWGGQNDIMTLNLTPWRLVWGSEW